MLPHEHFIEQKDSVDLNAGFFIQEPPRQAPNRHRDRIRPFSRRNQPNAVRTAASNEQLDTPHLPCKHFLWCKDFPSKVDDKWVSLRMTIHPLQGNTFPQYHEFILSCPAEDMFFMWKCTINPFNFASLVRMLKWELPQAAGDPMAAAFDQFGLFVRERVMECATSSSKYPQSFCIATCRMPDFLLL